MTRPTRVPMSSPILQPIGHNLTELALHGQLTPHPAHGEETARILEVLLRRRKHNPVLLGDAPATRFAIIGEVTRRMASDTVHCALNSRHVWMLDFEMLVSSAPDHTAIEQRLREICWQINRDNALLFVDPLDDLIGLGGGVPFVDATGAERRYDAVTLLKPLLGRSQIQLIGATTLDRYWQHIESDASMQRHMQEIVLCKARAGS